MRALILVFALGLVLAASAQAAPRAPTSIRAANVVTVQGVGQTGSGARRVDQAGARSTNCWRTARILASEPATPITFMPPISASCTAALPTPPAAVWTRTHSAEAPRAAECSR